MSLERNRKVSIETGHTYTSDDLLLDTESERRGIRELNRELTPFETRCAELGQAAAACAGRLGFDVKTHVLLDDVEVAYAQHRSEDPWKYASLRGRAHEGAKIAYEPDTVTPEASLVADAEQQLQALGTDSHSIRMQTRAGIQRVKLRGYSELVDPSHPSCDILDVSWHIHRSKDADILLTILHENYFKQQARVQALAAAISGTSVNTASMATLFLNDAGDPVSLERWYERSADASNYYDELEKLLKLNAHV